MSSLITTDDERKTLTIKTIDINHSVYELCTQYPELIDIMQELGFEDIVKPGMLKSAGRFMTLKKGAALKRIDLSTIKGMLAGHGFTVSE